MCTFKVNVVASGGVVVLQSIRLGTSSATFTVFTPALGSDCGLALSDTASSPTTVTFTLTAPTTGWTAGEGPGTLGGELNGVPSAQYVSSSCSLRGAKTGHRWLTCEYASRGGRWAGRIAGL